MGFYQRIRDLREDEDLTQAQIAEKLKLHKTQYCRYEQGISNVPLDFAKELAEYYKVSIDYIAGITNDKGGLHKNTKTENEVLNLFNSINEFRKGRIMQLLIELSEEQREEKAKNKETA